MIFFVLVGFNLKKLESGESDILAWADSDQTVINYLVFRSGISYYNYAWDELATGNHWSSKFDVIDNILYDQKQPITYIHYMSVGASTFTDLCSGKDVDIAYRDVFLHYRYLKCPEQKPQSFSKPSLLAQLQKNTVGFINQKISNVKLNYRNFRDRLNQ
jgi:hypothetical protein